MRLSFEDGERELVLVRLGLPDSADDAALGTRLAAWIQEDPTAPPATNASINGETDPANLPPTDGDFVVIDVQSFARMRRDEATAQAVVEANRVRDRDELIDEAIHDGKFGPARRGHYQARYDSDPEGTTTLIARLMRNTVPLEARGADAPTDDVADDAYPSDWVPEVAARASSAAPQPVAAPPVRRNRVHGEA